MSVVIHLTSAHNRYDTRIFLKECQTISKSKFEVFLFVSDFKEDEKTNNLNIINLNTLKTSSRLLKIISFYINFLKRVNSYQPDIIHFHDPELIILGFILKLKGFTVIFDIHESTHLQILQKSYIPNIFKISLSFAYFKVERFFSKKYDALIAATPYISKSFNGVNDNIETINNYPLLDDLLFTLKAKTTSNEIIYFGGINKIRGIIPLINAIESTTFKLNLIGNFLEKNLKSELEKLPGWKNVIYHGFCGRKKINEIISRSSIGIVTFHDAPNHINAQPNKLFEYMSCGLPIVGSNFPLWKEIIEGNNCGICVNPSDSTEILSAIKDIMSDPNKILEFGQNGRKAIETKYNWEIEGEKLINLYNTL